MSTWLRWADFEQRNGPRGASILARTQYFRMNVISAFRTTSSLAYPGFPNLDDKARPAASADAAVHAGRSAKGLAEGVSRRSAERH